MIKVNSIVTVYEIDGAETKAMGGDAIHVASHWNRNTLVVLVIGDRRYTVSASDLSAAITNARNAGQL